MVGHETVGVYCTTRGEGTLLLVFRVDHVIEDEDKLPIVIFVFEDLLSVYASEHHVVDTVWTERSGLSWHFFSMFKEQISTAKIVVFSETTKYFGVFFCSGVRPRN